MEVPRLKIHEEEERENEIWPLGCLFPQKEIEEEKEIHDTSLEPLFECHFSQRG